MDRRSGGYGYLAAAAMLVLLVISAAGCQALLGLAYLVKGTDVPAEYDGLKGKKVAVVCRPLDAFQFRNGGVAREVAENVSGLLKANVSKIHVIDQQEVTAWFDKRDTISDDGFEVGKDLKADMVVWIDLNSFSLLDGQTVFRGRAEVTVKVCDVEKREVAKKWNIQKVYPQGFSIPMDKSEQQFRSEFTTVLAAHIGRYFYPHDPHAEVGQDAAAGL
jgi:hypothetical protein